MFDQIIQQHQQKILTELQQRLQNLLPATHLKITDEFASEIVLALRFFLVDRDLEACVVQLQHIANNVLTGLKEASEIVEKGVLISRYVLLSVISRNSEKPINSLETFSRLNDVYEPLMIALRKRIQSIKPVSHELFPRDLSKTSELGLFLFDFKDLGLFILDKNLNIIYWGKGMTRLFGINDSDVLGHNFLEKFPAFKDRSDMQMSIDLILQKGEESEIPSSECHFIGDAKVVDFKFAPLRNVRNEIVGISVFLHDVTEKMIKEIRLQKYEQYFANILSDAADAILVLDENDIIRMWNKAAEFLFGYPKEEIVGKEITAITADDDKSRQQNEWIGLQVREKGFVRNYRTHAQRKDGKIILLEVTRSAIRNENGDYIGSSVIYREVTQQEKFREQLLHSEKLSAVGSLVAGIAHEVGKPLTAISAIAQLLKTKTSDPYFQDKITIIQNQIDRIARTVRTLVDFSRPVQQKIEKVYLNWVIDQVLRIIKYDKRLKQHQIVANLKPDIPLVEANFDQLLQVFVNLCLNAADAMELQKEGKLELKTWNDYNWVYASVSDNGTGIAAENISRIFEPFFTTKEEGKGTGLGLWVSYNIVKRFSGQIEVESRTGQGTTFTISLPILKAGQNQDGTRFNG